MNVVLWILQILLSLLFLFSGVSKFLIPADLIAKSLPVALPYPFILFIGVCEILGGIGLVVPWLTGKKPGLTPLAAALLAIIMIGAAVISAMASISTAILPAVVCWLCAFVAWGRKGAVD